MGKLSGNTLLEALVAMVVIIFCSTLATVIYLNVLSSQSTAQKLKAYYITQEVVQQTIERKDFLDAQFGYEGLLVARSCKPLKGNNIIRLDITVTAEAGKKLWEQSQLVLHE